MLTCVLILFVTLFLCSIRKPETAYSKCCRHDQELHPVPQRLCPAQILVFSDLADRVAKSRPPKAVAEGYQGTQEDKADSEPDDQSSLFRRRLPSGYEDSL